jgi:hypothetical protein
VNDELERMWKWSWHNLRYYSPTGTEENHDKPVRIADLPSGDFNPGPPEYEGELIEI